MESLSEGQIRLVRLEERPLTGEDEGTARVTAVLSEKDVYRLESAAVVRQQQQQLQHDHDEVEDSVCPLQAPPPYIALSYTWGNVKVPLDIRINGKDGIAQVSPNCIHALEQIHNHFPNVPVWTDTLSINQGNVPEKAHQIGLMGKIYKSAWKVAVWFGNIDYSDISAVYDELVELARPNANTSLDDKELSAKRWQLLQKISEIDWFHRAWTFQEIRLAEDAVVLFGRTAVPWQDFIDTVHTVKSFEPNVSTIPLRSRPAAFYRFSYVPQDRFFAMLDELNSGTKTDLAGLLFLTWYRAASEKRDKVYSVLGSHLMTSSDHGLTVDYQIPWQSLCIKTARAAINASQNLKILRIAGMIDRWKNPATQTWNLHEFRELLQTTSWAPDWWRPPVQTRTWQSLIFDERGCFSKLDFCCPPFPQKQDVEDPNPMLSLNGVLLGIIEIEDRTRMAYVHAPPMCARFMDGAQINPEDDDVFIQQVPTYAFLPAVEKHLHGDCTCATMRQHSLPTMPKTFHHPTLFGQKPRELKFGLDRFALTDFARPEGKSEAEWPAQVLAKSVESGDWLVLLEGGGLPFILRPAKDGNDRLVAVRDLQSMTSPKYPLPSDAGCFVLVGEASMCWDQLWPRRWSTYCRLGKFVIV